ncbi:MAG: hypothetical protein QGI09_07345, partial [Dehalococcoidia bacterium]|nr:hypothetical protein [Dehalococcoidia bacterium]
PERASEEPSLAQAEHWPQLRDAAAVLASVVQAGAPFPQLLSFPWQGSPEHNGELSIRSLDGEVKVSLANAEDPVVQALRPSNKTIGTRIGSI